MDVKHDDLERDNIILSDVLKNYESPFLWHSTEKRGMLPDNAIMRHIEKLAEVDIEEPNFSMKSNLSDHEAQQIYIPNEHLTKNEFVMERSLSKRNMNRCLNRLLEVDWSYGFIILLKLVVEYYVKNVVDKCWECIEKMENLIEKEASGNNADYKNAKLSLGHVITSARVHLLALTGQEDKAQIIGQDIIPMKVMKERDQASLLALKARFYINYENGSSIAVELMREAYALEPNNPTWEYLLAKMLRFKRREVLFSTEIPKEELKLLERAFEKSGSQRFLIYLAQVYRECASQAWKQHKDKPGFYTSDLFASIENMNTRSFHCYKQAYEMNPDNPSLLRRIGYGVMNIPKKQTDFNFALKCLKQSLKISENNVMTLHVLGTFYHRFGNDNVKALEYFEKTVELRSHAGLCDMVRLKYILDPAYNPCEDIESGLKWNVKKMDRSHLLAQLGGFFLFIRRDVSQSIKYFRQIIDEDRDCPEMKTFKSFFLRMYEPINLYEYIVNEALLILRNTSSSKNQLDEDVNHNVANTRNLENFVDKLREDFPLLMERKPDPFLVDKLHHISKEIMEREMNKRSKNGDRRYNQGGHRHPQESRRGRGRYQPRGEYTNWRKH